MNQAVIEFAPEDTMRATVAIAFLLSISPAISIAQTPSWLTKNYHVLVDGNQLYSYCQSYETNVKVVEEGIEYRTAASQTDVLYAGQCWGYILAVVDSVPAGEGFDPDPDVKASQYMDVVFAYLRDHPESRHLPAYEITRTALSVAFPTRPKH